MISITNNGSGLSCVKLCAIKFTLINFSGVAALFLESKYGIETYSYLGIFGVSYRDFRLLC